MVSSTGRCQHFDSRSNKYHLKYFLDDSYDLDYVEAVLNEDMEEVDRIEDAALALGFGPLMECNTVANFSSQRLYCRKSDLTPITTLTDTDSREF